MTAKVSRSARFSALALWAVCACAACGQALGVQRGDAGGTGIGMDAGTSPRGDADTGAMDGPDALVCADRRAPCENSCCAANEVCGGGRCCVATALCGGQCCAPEDRCEFGACVRDCGGRVRCGEPGAETCCDPSNVCYLGTCVIPGSACSDTQRCPDDAYCEPTLQRCLPRAGGAACEYRPPTGRFAPRVKWSWSADPAAFPTHTQVMMQPLVANLTDDNADGRIDARDVPDVAFTTFAGNDYWGNGILRIVRGDTGARIFPAPTVDPGYRLTPGASLAIADVDAISPGPEIIACSASVRLPTSTAGHVLLLGADGALIRDITSVPCGFSAPAVADMDGDGTPEIVVRGLAFHADGRILPGFAGAPHDTAGTSVDEFPALADLDGDGVQEIVLGNRALRLDGTVLWSHTTPAAGSPAIADLDLDGDPDVAVSIPSQHVLAAFDGRTGNPLWTPVEINREPVTTGPTGGGPPTISDFDGDGAPDIATAGGYNYLVVHGRDGSLLWEVASQDHSSRVTGSSVFDFEGDGSSEVVYNDELSLRVMRGTDGRVLLQQCNTSGTLWEYPVIVDVDADDSADIVLMANNYAFGCGPGMPGPTGIRVFSDPDAQWVRTRRIWNQHTYHVTNVDEDGRIPRRETPHWTRRYLNSFRQNVQPDGLFDAANLVPADLGADLDGCPDRITIRVRVVNVGRAGAPAGVPVTFYAQGGDGGGRRIGRTETTRRLLPGESEIVRVVYLPPRGEAYVPVDVYAVINDGGDMPLTTLHECRTDDNRSRSRTFACQLPG